MTPVKKKADTCKTVPVGGYKVHNTSKKSRNPHSAKSKSFIRGDTNRQLTDRIAKEENRDALIWMQGANGRMIALTQSEYRHEMARRN